MSMNKNSQVRSIRAAATDPAKGQVYGDPDGKCWTVVSLKPLTLSETFPASLPMVRRPTPQTFAKYRKVAER
jgi:hypothetical protein